MSWIRKMIDRFLPAISSRHYDAGDYSRLNANWRTINQSAEYTDRYSRDAVRARARDIERSPEPRRRRIFPPGRNREPGKEPGTGGSVEAVVQKTKL